MRIALKAEETDEKDDVSCVWFATSDMVSVEQTIRHLRGHEADSYQHVMDVSRDADNYDPVVTGLDIPGTKWTF